MSEHKVDCIIKLGGSVITRKSELETVCAEGLVAATDVLLGLKRCIVVHGAGSFGHFQASKYNIGRGYVHLGDEKKSEALRGFCETRLSVTKLNHMVVEALVGGGVPAVGLGPCGRWRTRGRSEVTQSDCEGVAGLLHAGFVPVLHGDGVLDDELGFTILSGDTIIKELCNYFKPQRVVFLSDVEGIYTRPPTDPDAQLIPKILVKPDGSIATTIATNNLAHDVTGGIEGKIAAARSIIKTSKGAVPVFICKLGTPSAKAACRQQDKNGDFQGTVVRLWEGDG